ncbi:MAG TPA: hypothetical protein VHI99_11280 [Vicinamibacterales bacterium]|nr:hypothetical protein [Vicinamibacterales bacterium]
MPGGWLLVLTVVLYLWQPVTFAGELLLSLDSLGMRGAPAVIELLAHAGSAGLSVAASRALSNGNPAGPAMAAFALAVAAILGVQSLYWSSLPHHTMPGDKLPLAILMVAHSVAWLIYLRRSKRVRAIGRIEPFESSRP